MTRPVVTLTLNPAIDAACVADEVVPMRKVRTPKATALHGVLVPAAALSLPTTSSSPAN